LKGSKAPTLRVPAEEAAEVRDMKYIPLEELANGIRDVVEKNISVDRLGLYRLLAQLLGFGRLSENMTKRLDEALALLKDVIDVNGETLTKKDS